MSDKMCYTVAEVAEIFNTTEPRIHNIIKAGYLKVFRIGRILIRKEDLVDFMQSAVGYDLTDGVKIKLGGTQ